MESSPEVDSMRFKSGKSESDLSALLLDQESRNTTGSEKQSFSLLDGQHSSFESRQAHSERLVTQELDSEDFKDGFVIIDSQNLRQRCLTPLPDKDRQITFATVHDAQGLVQVQKNYFGHVATLKEISQQFKDARNQTKKRIQKERKVEVLSALSVARQTRRNLSNAVDAGLKQWDNMFLLKVIPVLTLSGIIQGWDTIVISIISLYLKEDFTSFQNEFFVSIGSLGAAFGALVSGIFIDKVGRKPVVVAANFLYVLGSFVVIYTEYSQLLMIARLIIGFSIGITSMNLPLYISEICPMAVRGRVVALYTFLIIVGQLLANIFALMVGEDWEILLFVNTLIAFLQIILMVWIPESPRWLASQGKQE